MLCICLLPCLRVSVNVLRCVSPVMNAFPCMCMLRYAHVPNYKQVWETVDGVDRGIKENTEPKKKKSYFLTWHFDLRGSLHVYDFQIYWTML